jgi:hypothetical protein
MCHPGLDPTVLAAATTGPRLATTAPTPITGGVLPTIDPIDLVVLDVPDPSRRGARLPSGRRPG